MVDQPVVESVQKYLGALVAVGLPVRFAVVFGSRAAGQAHAWSDIDLLVVSPRFDTAFSRQDINMLWRTAARTDSRIEPIPCGVEQWERGTSSEIVEIARREGQTIPLPVEPASTSP
jgi:Nucleotidyltransferase domain